MNLYVIPFDHRSTFVKGIFDFLYPLTEAQKKLVESYKAIVFQGFLRAREEYRGIAQKDEFAFFIDEEFGSKTIALAKKSQIPFAIAVEKSGKPEFHFEYGKEFGKHIMKSRPRFAKALVRYLPGNSKENIEQRGRLKQFVQFCRKNAIATIVEVLIPLPEKLYTSGATGNFERFAKPRLTAKSIQELEKAGVCPTLWKLEPQESQGAWKRIIRAANGIPIIVLGGGESNEKIETHLKVASRFQEVIGFAIGRTVFMKPLLAYRKRLITKREAIKRISDCFLELVAYWETEKNKLK